MDWPFIFVGESMVNQKEIDLLVYGHIYEWVKPKIWNKNINDVKDGMISDADVNVFDNGV